MQDVKKAADGTREVAALVDDLGHQPESQDLMNLFGKRKVLF